MFSGSKENSEPLKAPRRASKESHTKEPNLINRLRPILNNL
jgi:hypothetical protein